MDNILDRADEIIRAFIICNCDGYCSECPFRSISDEKCYNTLSNKILSLIRTLQSELAKVTAERDALKHNAEPVRHGKWLEDGEYQICSECGEEHAWSDYRAAYCDTCGAKMEREDNDGTD